MTEALVRRFYKDFFKSGENFSTWFYSGYEEAAAGDPSVSFIEFSLVLGFFELFVVAVQDLNMEFVCIIDFGEVV